MTYHICDEHVHEIEPNKSDSIYNSNAEGIFEMVRPFSVRAAKSSDDLAKMRQRFGKLSDTDLDAYRFVCTQWLG